jgi:8-oxo-dGTP pyrophosphatase MutT (NUDIX family)
MEKRFKNRENEEVHVDGRTFWISRSVAVVGIIFAVKDGDPYVLVEKRSEMMDASNKWAVVSGYLDWDESAYEAVLRETYEETGLYLPDIKSSLIFDNYAEPVYVASVPSKDAKQNVTLGYVFIYDFDMKRDEFPTEVEKFKTKEVSEVRWVKVLDIILGDGEFSIGDNWAFNHNTRIREAYHKHLVHVTR